MPLVNIPVALHSAERNSDLKFKLLDSRNKAPIRYERINAETGEEVPWSEVVKGFEYKKGNYVLIDKEEIEAFVDRSDIDPRMFETPYYLVPEKKAEKGYLLLRETLKRSGKVGVARVVIRTRQYLAIVMPLGDALVLDLLRFPEELASPDEFNLPGRDLTRYRVSRAEISMAEQLIDSMTAKWNPGAYRDEFHERLRKLIKSRISQKGRVARRGAPERPRPEASTNVVDFATRLKRSLEKGKRPVKRAPAARAASRPRARAARRRRSA